MIILVNDLRHAALSNPEQFANGETTPLVLSAAEDASFAPDVATLALALFDNLGNVLAISTVFTDAGGGEYTATIDCKNQSIVNMFMGQPVAYRAPVNLAIVDTNRVWAVQYAEMANNPLVQPPVPPGPLSTYLTTADFAGLTIPIFSDPFDIQIAFLQAVGAILKGGA